MDETFPMSTRTIARPEVSALLYAAVEEIESAGVKPSPGHIVWLHELAVRQVLPGLTDRCSFLSPCVHVGGVKFYPLTIEAEMWLDQYALKWWGEQAGMELFSTAWAMAHSGPNTPAGFFSRLTTRGMAWTRVRVWLWNVKVPRTALSWVVGKFLGLTPVVQVDATGLHAPSGPTPSSLDWGEFIAGLCHSYPALTPKQIFKMTDAECLELLRNARVGESGETNRKDYDERRAQVAFFEYRLAIRHIIKTSKEPTHAPE